MLVVCTVLVAVCAALPMTTEAGKEATLRQQVEGMESFGMTVSDQAYEGMRRRHGGSRPTRLPASILVFSPIMTLVFAGHPVRGLQRR